jgi:hypothetical protein
MSILSRFPTQHGAARNFFNSLLVAPPIETAVEITPPQAVPEILLREPCQRLRPVTLCENSCLAHSAPLDTTRCGSYAAADCVTCHRRPPTRGGRARPSRHWHTSIVLSQRREAFKEGGFTGRAAPRRPRSRPGGAHGAPYTQTLPLAGTATWREKPFSMLLCDLCGKGHFIRLPDAWRGSDGRPGRNPRASPARVPRSDRCNRVRRERPPPGTRRWRKACRAD